MCVNNNNNNRSTFPLRFALFERRFCPSLRCTPAFTRTLWFFRLPVLRGTPRAVAHFYAPHFALRDLHYTHGVYVFWLLHVVALFPLPLVRTAFYSHHTLAFTFTRTACLTARWPVIYLFSIRKRTPTFTRCCVYTPHTTHCRLISCSRAYITAGYLPRSLTPLHCCSAVAVHIPA